MNEKMKLFLGLGLPYNNCNLKCDYCYIHHVDKHKKNNSPQFKYSPKYMAKCLSVKRLGGLCLINMTADGETLLQPDIVELIYALLAQGHYLELVTNGTVFKVMDEIFEMPYDFRERIEFKISFHYKELLRLNLLDRFFEYISKIKQHSCSFTLELMPNDDLEKDIDDIIAICLDRTGAKPHLTVGRDMSKPNRTLLTSHTKEEYIQVWRKFESKMFDLKMKTFGVRRREFCYAGCWALHIDGLTGETSQCCGFPVIQNIFLNPNKPIKLIPIGHYCLLPHCINAHAYLTAGMIPEINTPSYLDMRNRVCQDGSQWFSEKCRIFFNHKLNETNREFTGIEKLYNTLTIPFILTFQCFLRPKETLRKFRRELIRLHNLLANYKGR